MTDIQIGPTSQQVISASPHLSLKQKKVLAVALASLALFGLQLSLSLWATLSLTFSATLLTWITPENKEDWFRTTFEGSPNDWISQITGIDSPYKALACIVAFLIARPFILYLLLSFSKGLARPCAQTAHLDRFFKNPGKFSFIACVNAPLCEEILFRGTLLEGLDALGLSERASDLLQSFLFGLAHLRSKIQEGMYFVVLFVLSVSGYMLTRLKREQKTLAAPMIFHSANNLGACLHFFLNMRPS